MTEKEKLGLVIGIVSGLAWSAGLASSNGPLIAVTTLMMVCGLMIFLVEGEQP